MLVNNIIVEVEGVDKAGKDTIGKYISVITNYSAVVNVRGLLTQLVYNDKFNRNNDYRILYKPLIVFLDVNPLDHKIRCMTTNEPKININKDREVYYEYIKELEKHGITVLKFNTSELTPYQIACKVKDYLDNTKYEDFICSNYVDIKPLGLYTKKDLEGEDIFYEYK